MPQLTPHFSEAELNVAGAPAAVRAAALRTAQLLERVRTAVGDRPILVTSGYRPPERNAAAGGASNSQHLTGAAADFKVSGMDRLSQTLALRAAAKAGKLGAFGQLILYPFTTGHAHISLPRGGSALDGEILYALKEGGYERVDMAPGVGTGVGLAMLAVVAALLLILFTRAPELAA